MAVQYQVDGNIFSEITTNWLCAHVREFLIKARQLGTDQAGNAVEYLRGWFLARKLRIFPKPTLPVCGIRNQ
jgi:hypothetical protein